MKLFDNEQVLFTTKNKKFVLTTHRVREESKSVFGSTIKSILLTNVDSCQLESYMPYRKMINVVWWPILINGVLFIINNYLVKSGLLNLLFGDFRISSQTLYFAFQISLLISTGYIVWFFMSIRKMIFIRSSNLEIGLELKWLSFNERENFISKIEETIVKYVNN